LSSARTPIYNHNPETITPGLFSGLSDPAVGRLEEVAESPFCSRAALWNCHAGRIGWRLRIRTVLVFPYSVPVQRILRPSSLLSGTPRLCFAFPRFALLLRAVQLAVHLVASALSCFCASVVLRFRPPFAWFCLESAPTTRPLIASYSVPSCSNGTERVSVWAMW
jgi:hypothetical protein